MPELLEDNQVIDDGLAHEDIVFDDRRDLIPLRLATMAEGAAVAEPVEDSYCRQENIVLNAYCPPTVSKAGYGADGSASSHDDAK